MSQDGGYPERLRDRFAKPRTRKRSVGSTPTSSANSFLVQMNNKQYPVKCLDIKGEVWEVPASKLSFRPSVYGVIIENGKILLSPQWDGYDFPGGAIEVDETIEQALIREVKEETGLDAETGELITCESSFFKLPNSEKYVNSILIYFSCKITGGEISETGLMEDEKNYVKKAEWVELERVGDIRFYNSVDSKKIIKLAKNNLVKPA